MKKIFLLLIFSIVPFTIKAQTLEQTMEYIEANVLNYCIKKEFKTKCQNTAITTTIGFFSSVENNPPSE